MICELRPWRMEDATELQKILNSKKILDNLRAGIPYSYNLADAKAFIQSMSETEPDFTYAFAITADGRLAGSIGAFRKENIHSCTAFKMLFCGTSWIETGRWFHSS